MKNRIGLPAFRASAKFHHAGFEFLFEELSHAIAYFLGERKLFAAVIIILVRLQSAAWLVGIAA